MPGAFKLDHLQPVKPILSPKFSNFYIFILGSSILITPERGRLKMGKWNSPNLSETTGFESLGHSNWTICSFALREDQVSIHSPPSGAFPFCCLILPFRVCGGCLRIFARASRRGNLQSYSTSLLILGEGSFAGR